MFGRKGLATLAIGMTAVASIAVPAIAGLGSPSSDVAAPVTAQASGDALQTSLLARLAATPADTLAQVFVHGTSIDRVLAGAERSGLQVITTYDQVAIAVAAGTPGALALAAIDPDISYLEDADVTLSFDLDTSHEATRGIEVINGVDYTETFEHEIYERVKLPNGKNHPTKRTSRIVTRTVTTNAQYDGTGVGIAIIDSGVDAEHPFFADADGNSRVVKNLEYYCHDLVTIAGDDAGQPCLIDSPYPQTDTSSVGGHGTHVAGIAAGSITTLSDGSTIMGAAPKAEITSLSVGATLSITGSTTGLYWVLENHADPCGDGSCAPIKVVNNSWGPDPDDYNPSSTVGKLSDAIIAEGVVVAFAASNDGGDGSTNSVNPYAQNPTPGLLNVANYDDGGTGTRDGGLDGSSSRGEAGKVQTYPDLAAPGANILSSCRLYLPVCSTGATFVENGDYNTISGTSMATPHIAGIVAQLFQADPTLTPAQIEDILEDTAYKFSFGGAYEADVTFDGSVNNDGTTSFDKGHGLVDVVAAIGRILGLDSPGKAGTCVADAPVITDAAGDATAYLGQPTPMPNETNLDIIEGRLAERRAADGTLAGLDWTITVADLTEAGPSIGVGEYFDWNFSYNGQSYYLGAGFDRTSETEPRFLVGFFDTTRTTLRSGLEGAYDYEADTISVFLPIDTFVVTDQAGEPALGAGPAFGEGAVFGSHEIVARYDQGLLVPDADTASGACPFTIGLGAVPPPAPVVEPPAEPAPGSGDFQPDDGTYELDGPAGVTTFEASAGPGTAVGDPGAIVGEGTTGPVGITSPGGDAYVVDIRPGQFSTVTVDAVASESDVQDIDFVVFDGAGNEVASSAASGGVEHASFTITRPGSYTVQIDRFATVEASYELTVSLG